MGIYRAKIKTGDAPGLFHYKNPPFPCGNGGLFIPIVPKDKGQVLESNDVP